MPDSPRNRSTPDNAPIFIVGDARSGTTLMRLILSAHPRIYILHESAFYFWKSLCPRSYDGHEFLRHYFYTLNFRWLHLDPEEVLDTLPSELPQRELGRAFREIMRVKAASYGRVRFGDKTPLHTPRLKEMFHDFPNARVIQMVRDPRTEVTSLVRMPFGTESYLANSLLYETTRRRTAPYADRILRVKLEDLLAEPEPTLRRTLEFVGEEWDEAVLDHAAHRLDTHDMEPYPWLETATTRLAPTPVREQWDEPDKIRLIELICRKSMATYGYRRANLADAPGPVRTWLDLLRQTPEVFALGHAASRLIQGWGRKDFWQRDWSQIDWEETYAPIKKVNPRWWREHPDYQMPPAPPLLTAGGQPWTGPVAREASLEP